MPQPKTSRESTIAREKEIACLDLRKRGKNYRDIATELNISVGGAHTAVSRALAKLAEECKEKAEEVRDIELERMDAMIEGLWTDATTGDVAAVAAVVKLQERRSRLLGLDAPTRQHITTMTHEEAMQQLDDPDKSE